MNDKDIRIICELVEKGYICTECKDICDFPPFPPEHIIKRTKEYWGNKYKDEIKEIYFVCEKCIDNCMNHRFETLYIYYDAKPPNYECSVSVCYRGGEESTFLNKRRYL